MINYKGYNIPDSFEEIMKMNEELHPHNIFTSNILYQDKDKMKCPLDTISFEEFSKNYGDDAKISSMIEEYKSNIINYIDHWEAYKEDHGL